MRMPDVLTPFWTHTCPPSCHARRVLVMPGWKALWLLVLGLSISVGSAWAQGRTVEGVVKDAQSGQPLPGVSVQIKGTASGTITNDQGAFQLSLPPGHDTLIFSYVGYSQKMVPVGQTSSPLQLPLLSRPLP